MADDGQLGPRRSGLRALVMLGVILGPLWVADTLARTGAESLAAARVRDAAGLREKPDVQIGGVLSLPQLIRGSYKQVDVTTLLPDTDPLPVERLESKLNDVRVPFGDLLAQEINRVTIKRSEQLATIRYEDLNTYLDQTDRAVQVAHGGDDQVRLTATVDLTGQSLAITADALSVENGELQVTPRQVDTGNGTVDQATRLVLKERLQFAVPLGELPFGHTLTGAGPSEEGIGVAAHGEQVVWQP